MGPHKSTRWYSHSLPQRGHWGMQDWVSRVVNANVKHLTCFIDLSPLDCFVQRASQ